MDQQPTPSGSTHAPVEATVRAYFSKYASATPALRLAPAPLQPILHAVAREGFYSGAIALLDLMRRVDEAGPQGGEVLWDAINAEVDAYLADLEATVNQMAGGLH